ncbi:MAG: beta-N-acetylhexosaminidase [Candidatus Borkfalkiaceae bacterium]|nr:beta-N-acetylhexosaminidase [Christensenellaceae bacterium]
MLAVMLDASRNGVLKTEEIKRFIDRVKIMGYDTVGIYMEDVYEIDGEPYFGHLRGRYSKAELKEINAYAKAAGMNVLPCIQTLAHLHGMFRWRQYAAIRDTDDILLIDEPQTYALIDKMFATLRECFDCKTINIGMDEAWNVGLGAYKNKHGFTNRLDLMFRHLSKVIAIAGKYSFDCMMWSDMFFNLAGEKDDIAKYVPDNVTLCYWDYYTTSENKYCENIEKHLCITPRTAFAGGAWTWASFAPQNGWTIKSMRPAMSACRKYGVKDVIITLWGDDGRECSYNAVLPSLFFCAEKYLHDTPDDRIKEKFYALFGVPFDDFMFLDLPDSIGRTKTPFNGTSSKFGLYQDSFLGQFDYHISLGDGEACEGFADQLARVAKSAGEFAYLFENAANLCRVLALKYDLGVRTRKAYSEKNGKALQDLADKVYPSVIERIEKFYQSFKKVWDTECKPFGFEVHDHRIGGLLHRLRACRETLLSFLGGKIERIEELEVPVLPYDDVPVRSDVRFDHRHAYAISMNREVW